MTMETTDSATPNDAQSSDSNNLNNNNNDQSKTIEKGNIDDERLAPTGESSDTTEAKKDDGQNDKTDQKATDEVLDLGDTSNFDANARSELFQRGLQYEKKGKQQLALQCYFGSMNGLSRKTNFVLLPECLHNIADIYQAQGNYERAIHFAQAEKLFYELALIETQEIQKKIEEVAGTEDCNPTKDLNELNIEAMRADEYEHLARLCLDRNQSQLALEYAGKCAKIRQQVFGENHSKTKETLDFFASLYAEVGKEQYTDSFTLLNNMTSEDYQAPQIVTAPSPGGEPVSILRHRTPPTGQKKDDNSPGQSEREKKQVRFHESVEDNRSRDRDESEVMINIVILVAVTVLFLLGAIIS